MGRGVLVRALRTRGAAGATRARASTPASGNTAAVVGSEHTCSTPRIMRVLPTREATSERNLSFYEHHGFAIVEIHLPGGGLPLWRIWREPRAA